MGIFDIFNSVIGLPSQIISTSGNIITSALSIPGQIAGSIGGTIGGVVNTAGQTIQGTVSSVANVAGQTVTNVADSTLGLLSSPIVIIGIGIVLVVLLKR